MKKNKSITIISILTILSFIIGFSYAYFTTVVIGNEGASTHRVTTGKMQLTYSGVDAIDMANAEPPTTKTATFTVTNTGTINITSYQVYFSNVINTLAKPEEMVYTLTCTSSDANPCSGTTGEVQVPTGITSSSGLTQTSIAPNTVHTYTLSVTFKDTGSNQNYNQDKQVSFKITINELKDFSTLVKRQGYDSIELFWEHAGEISEVTFQNQINVPANAFKSWDVSSNQDKTIMAYIIDDGLNQNTYHLYIQSNDDVIYANSDMSNWFRFATATYPPTSKLTKINNLNMLNTANVTSMSFMFSGCSGLVTLDLSPLNTTNVTKMRYMFDGCSGLTTLDLSSFNTTKVTDMYSMFSLCSGLTTLDLSSFNTTNVTSMFSMFEGCSGLSTLDLTNFNTANVTNMESMFSRCSGLTTLDLSPLDTTNVTIMSGMFYECSGLVTLDLSPLNTTNVTNMSGMFHGCSGLSTLDLTPLDTTNVTNMSFMFRGCSGLITLDLSTLDTANVTYMFYMFRGCNGLATLNLSNATFTQVTSYDNMFRDITSGINILVKDNDAKIWIETRLSEASRTGNVTVYVP